MTAPRFVPLPDGRVAVDDLTVQGTRYLLRAGEWHYATPEGGVGWPTLRVQAWWLTELAVVEARAVQAEEEVAECRRLVIREGADRQRADRLARALDDIAAHINADSPEPVSLDYIGRLITRAEWETTRDTKYWPALVVQAIKRAAMREGGGSAHG